MGNAFAHIEINTRDLDRARRFYESVFDWKIHYEPVAGEEVPYGLIDTGTPPGGGLFQVPLERPLGVTVYVGVSNIEESLSKIEAAGGRTMMARMEVPGEGWFAIFSDLDGNVLGLWENKPA